MNTGQMLLVLLAITMLSTVSLTLNSMLLIKTQGMLDAEATIDAISYGQGVIDEVMSAQRSYDDSTISQKIYDSTKLTPIAKLGPSSTEKSNVSLPDSLTSSRQYYLSDKYYNDVGDYNGYRRSVLDPIMGTYKIFVTVAYVQEKTPDVLAPAQTFAKRVTVKVWQMNMGDTLHLTDVAVYRKFF